MSNDFFFCGLNAYNDIFYIISKILKTYGFTFTYAFTFINFKLLYQNKKGEYILKHT